MKVALNLLGYTPGRGGVDTYLLNLFRALERIPSDHEYLVLCDPLVAEHFQSSQANFFLRTLKVEKPSVGWLLRGVTKRITGVDLLNWKLKGLAADVIHHPLTTLNPFDLPQPSVLTFHDLQHEFFPELFSSKELNRRRCEYPSSVRQANAVIAISQHVKDCLVERYAVEAEKVHVVHHGYPEQFVRIGSPDRLQRVKEKYALDRPFMIYPAATWAHKNHLRLLNAVKLLVEREVFDGELILTGVPMDFHAKVMEEISRLSLEKVVRWLGYLPQEDMPCLYSLARLMVFPSLFEGFGLPVVEAMACGCPVVMAGTTSLPEVAGGAAACFAPESVEDIAASLEHYWNDESMCRQLSEAGLQRAGFFSWDKAARETVAVYRKVSLS